MTSHFPPDASSAHATPVQSRFSRCAQIRLHDVLCFFISTPLSIGSAPDLISSAFRRLRLTTALLFAAIPDALGGTGATTPADSAIPARHRVAAGDAAYRCVARNVMRWSAARDSQQSSCQALGTDLRKPCFVIHMTEKSPNLQIARV